jgi:hypothetical protein
MQKMPPSYREELISQIPAARLLTGQVRVQVG